MTQPPPPPPPPPAEWTPSRDFSVGDAISYGWKAYWKNLGPLLLLALVALGAGTLIGVVANSTESLVGTIALQLIGVIVGVVVAMGLIRATLAVCRGEPPRVDMLLQTEGFGAYFIAAILVGVGVFVGLMLLVVPGIIAAVMWHFFGFVIVENPETSAIGALRRSAEITRGCRWQLLGLGLLLLLINLVGALPFGLGLPFAYGITSMTLAYAYRTLSGQPVARL